MKQKFKVGDKLMLVKTPNMSWDYWAEQDKISVGDVITVDKVSDESLDDGCAVAVMSEGGIYWQDASSFKLIAPDRIVIVLRRASDDRTIRRELEKLGFTWASGNNPTTMSYFEKHKCRVLILDSKSKRLYYDYSGSRLNLNRLKDKEIKRGGIILNTRPSVTNVVNELKRYLS